MTQNFSKTLYVDRKRPGEWRITKSKRRVNGGAYDQKN